MRAKPNPANHIWQTPTKAENRWTASPSGEFVPPVYPYTSLVYTDDENFKYTDGRNVEYKLS